MIDYWQQMATRSIGAIKRFKEHGVHSDEDCDEALREISDALDD